MAYLGYFLLVARIFSVSNVDVAVADYGLYIKDDDVTDDHVIVRRRRMWQTSVGRDHSHLQNSTLYDTEWS